MNIRSNGIPIDDVTKMKSPRVNVQKKRTIKNFDRYVEMRHSIYKERSVVTPFDKEYIKELKREGYKLVDDFRINVVGGYLHADIK